VASLTLEDGLCYPTPFKNQMLQSYKHLIESLRRLDNYLGYTYKNLCWKDKTIPINTSRISEQKQCKKGILVPVGTALLLAPSPSIYSSRQSVTTLIGRTSI
jgi:hypothetical protein